MNNIRVGLLTTTGIRDYIDCVIGSVLWHINPRRLFNAKSRLLIYILNILFINE